MPKRQEEAMLMHIDDSRGIADYEMYIKTKINEIYIVQFALQS